MNRFQAVSLERPIAGYPYSENGNEWAPQPNMLLTGALCVRTAPSQRTRQLTIVKPEFSKAVAAPAAQISVRPLGGRFKRALDVSIAALSLVALLPLMTLVAALIWLKMGSPIFFAHDRIGWRGKSFRCYKFRTMARDAQLKLETALASDPELEREWRERRKLSNDPRVTPLGNFLRKSSIDELPQLINVLRGDMSCVGPRPVVELELSRYGRRSEKYLASRPGITGLWQVSGRSRTSYSTRVALDYLYVCRWSPLLDAIVLLKTIPALLRFKESA